MTQWVVTDGGDDDDFDHTCDSICRREEDGEGDLEAMEGRG